MNDFAGKLENFWNVFMNAGGYREVLKGLQNTLTIAVLGLLIGIVIGTVIAAVRVLPKYKRLPRVLNSICGFYVGCSAAPRWWCSFSCSTMCCCRCWASRGCRR